MLARIFALLLAGTLPLAAQVNIPPATSAKIGQRIWQNECSGTVAGLTSWNSGEAFASLGIGHFIWYPAGGKQTYQESFPGLVRLMVARQVAVPNWLAAAKSCPWADRAAFNAAKTSP